MAPVSIRCAGQRFALESSVPFPLGKPIELKTQDPANLRIYLLKDYARKRGGDSAGEKVGLKEKTARNIIDGSLRALFVTRSQPGTRCRRISATSGGAGPLYQDRVHSPRMNAIQFWTISARKGIRMGRGRGGYSTEPHFPYRAFVFTLFYAGMPVKRSDRTRRVQDGWYRLSAKRSPSPSPRTSCLSFVLPTLNLRHYQRRCQLCRSDPLYCRPISSADIRHVVAATGCVLLVILKFVPNRLLCVGCPRRQHRDPIDHVIDQ